MPLPEDKKPFEKGQAVTADRLNALRLLCNENRVAVGYGLGMRKEPGQTTIWVTDTGGNKAIPVYCYTDGGVAGGDKTTCTYTYTFTDFAGVILGTAQAPYNDYTRLPGVNYSPASFGFAVLNNDGNYDFFPMDEYSNYQQLYLNPDGTTGYKVNLDAKNGYLELTNPDETVQISLDLSTGDPVINLINNTGGTTASIDLYNDKIQISNAGAGIELSLADQHIVVYKSDGTQASISLDDLIAATTAQFQDVEYVSAIWDDGTNIVYQTKIMRAFCTTPTVSQESIAIIGAASCPNPS